MTKEEEKERGGKKGKRRVFRTISTSQTESKLARQKREREDSGIL